MNEALMELVILLKEEHTVSAYELHSSGLVQTLLNILNNVSSHTLQEWHSEARFFFRIELYYMSFTPVNLSKLFTSRFTSFT